jgi:hypothetical protein
VRIDTADGERILGQVEAEADNVHGSPHSLFGRANQPPFWHFDAEEWGGPCRSLDDY